ncbi:MAG: hypothetical protein LT106_10550, partial [Burkholderiaceae bacterium]|nr:hypothetical protein [Burkholderiaceae bacterium]
SRTTVLTSSALGSAGMMKESTTHRFFGAELPTSIDAASSDGQPASSALSAPAETATAIRDRAAADRPVLR